MVVRILAAVAICALLAAVVACSVVIYLGNAAAPTKFRPQQATVPPQPKAGAGQVVKAKSKASPGAEKSGAPAVAAPLPGSPDVNRQYTLAEAEQALDEARAGSRTRKELLEVVNMWYVFLSDPLFTKSATHEEHRQKLAAMAADAPRTATPLVAMAQSHLLEAWRERGYGPDEGVSPEVLHGWHQSAAAAHQLLDQAIAIGVEDAEAYALLLEVARIEGWPAEKARGVFDEGRQIDPTNLGLFEGMAEYLLPQWHGQPGDVERFAAEVPKMIAGDDGLDAYLHIAYAVSQFDSNLLFWGDFDRSLLVRGAEVVVRRYPTARNLVPFAALCTVAAQDRAAARRIQPAVKHKDAPRVWLWQRVADDYFAWCDAREINEGRAEWIWGAPQNYPGLAFSSDSKSIWCASGVDATAAIRWQLDKKKGDLAFPTQAGLIEALTVDANTSRVAAALGGERQAGWILWNLGMPHATPFVFRTSSACRAIAIHPKLPEVAFAIGTLVRRMDVATQTEDKALEVNEAVEQINYSADGERLAVSASSFWVWNAETGEKEYQLPSARGAVKSTVACEKVVEFDDQRRVWAIAFAPGSHPVKRSLVRFAADGKTWETLIADLHPEGPIQPHSAVLSPDRRQLAALRQRANAADEESILVWSLGDAAVKRLEGHVKHVGSLAFSPDGTKLASVSQAGGPVKIWNLTPSNQIRR
jgi:hypothetical protein